MKYSTEERVIILEAANIIEERLSYDYSSQKGFRIILPDDFEHFGFSRSAILDALELELKSLWEENLLIDVYNVSPKGAVVSVEYPRKRGQRKRNILRSRVNFSHAEAPQQIAYEIGRKVRDLVN